MAACAILVLEDEPLILMDLQFAVEDAGCDPLLAATLDEAERLLERDGDRIDSAILDVTLGAGKTCAPIAHALRARNIPFLLHTGDLDRQNETVRSLDAIIIAKPAPADHVVAEAMRLVEGAAAGAPPCAVAAGE